MSGNTYTIAEKIEICEKAIKAEKEGISLHKSSLNLGVSNPALYDWVRQFKAGTLTGKPGKKELVIPSSLIKDMTDEFNGTEPAKVETVNVMVFADSPENNIMLSVEKPNTSNVDEYNDAMDRLVFGKIEWCFVMKGFKF